jgi:hypothetical protein
MKLSMRLMVLGFLELRPIMSLVSPPSTLVDYSGILGYLIMVHILAKTLDWT